MNLKPTFEDLYRQNVDRIFVFCVSRVGRDQAEDLTADVFCKALGAWDRFEDRDSSPKAWLMQIAHNRIIEAWRSNARVSNDYRAGLVVDDVAIAVEDLDRINTLMGQLKKLPDRQQTVVTLRFLSELSVAEVASVLEITEEAVRAATMRGIRTLRSTITALPQKA